MFYLAARRAKARQRNADVAQLVAHHLAKVRVAGSSPVIRSDELPVNTIWYNYEEHHPRGGNATVEWPSGEATACKAVHTGSIPVSTSQTIAEAIVHERD